MEGYLEEPHVNVVGEALSHYEEVVGEDEGGEDVDDVVASEEDH